MPLFLQDHEYAAVQSALKTDTDPWTARVFWTLERRAQTMAREPGLLFRGSDVEWWHLAADTVMTVAGAHAVRPSQVKAAWLHEIVLALARRSEDEWVGPFFRNHAMPEPMGHLETAHLTWAVAFGLDLAPDVFSTAEHEELHACLREKALPLCRRWFEYANRQQNWGMILLAGVAVAAAILNERETIAWAAGEYGRRLTLFQDDGSYGESQQYANYAIYGLMLTHEALRRHDPKRFAELSLEPHIYTPRWWTCGLLYRKPLAGWSDDALNRVANFNDCSAIFRPHGDVLAHLAARGRTVHPVEAGLARWLFEKSYQGNPNALPFDRGTFGLVNDVNVLTLALLPESAPPVDPGEAGLDCLSSFSVGETFVRRSWQPRTVLAVNGEDQWLNTRNHRHLDAGSFILAHNNERLLLDPGHCCYRTAVQELNKRTDFHNTVTFGKLRQSPPRSNTGDREARSSRPGATARGRRLLHAQTGDITIVGYEFADCYGPPICYLARFWILCGEHALFIIDRIRADDPVEPTWHWLLNNRDAKLDFEQTEPGLVVARRGNAGIKLARTEARGFAGPAYHFVHDAYHPLPAMKGEGVSGSGLMFTDKTGSERHDWYSCHAIALDSYGRISRWNIRFEGRAAFISDDVVTWNLVLGADQLSFQLSGTGGLNVSATDLQANWEIRNPNA